MDSSEAKKILALYRPGDTDSPDPRMAQALALARRDPQLAAWFGQHCAAHVKLPGEPDSPPPGFAPKEEEPKPAPTTPTDADREQFISVNKAALVMVGLAMLILLAAFLWSLYAPSPKDAFESYRDRMARLVQRSYPMKIAADDPAKIREYFRTNEGAVGFELPRNLEKLTDTGAAVFTWHGHPVSLLGLNAGGNTNLYLFLVERSAFAAIPVPTKPEFERVGRLITASWTVGPRIYLLTGPDDLQVMQNYVE